MFPLVSVQVRQRGAWKLHPYNFIAQNCLLLLFWLHFYKLWGWEIATDTCAFTITLHQICTQTYLYSLPSYPATIGYFLFLFFTRHIPHYNRNTYTLLYKTYHTKVLLIWTMCSTKISHPYLTTLCFAFYTPAYHNALICKFSVQV